MQNVTKPAPLTRTPLDQYHATQPVTYPQARAGAQRAGGRYSLRLTGCDSVSVKENCQPFANGPGRRAAGPGRPTQLTLYA
jgi:hypothetical protein